MPRTTPSIQSGDFEELLLRPTEVAGQRDDASGCGAGCLKMILALEPGPGVIQSAAHGVSPFPPWLDFAHPEDAPFVWKCRPSTLVDAINRHGSLGPPRALGPRQYHVVHGASPDAPLEEIIAWLRGWQTMDGPLRLPSALLAHHGTHWMLAVGARIESGALAWVALADPDTESLICLTPDGFRDVFTPNTIGSHPDWFGRHVAVVPSFLPRPCAGSASESSIHPVVRPIMAPPPPMPAIRPPANRLPPADESPLLETVHRLAGTAHHPIVQSWLGALASARSLVSEHGKFASTAPVATASTRRSAHVLNADGMVLAFIRYRLEPLTLLQCRVNPTVEPVSPNHS
ncbi:MAG: hypothetical protein ACKV19_04405 [Verrucomicrobiales bacterium]